MRSLRDARTLIGFLTGVALVVGLSAPAATAQVPPLPVEVPGEAPDLPLDGDLELGDLGPLSAILACLPGGGLPDLPEVGDQPDVDPAAADELVGALVCILSTTLDLLVTALGDAPAPDLPVPDAPLP